MQRLLPPHLLLLTLIAMVLAGWIWPLENDVPLLLRWLFGIVSIIGIAVALKGARTFKDVGTNIKTFNKPEKLVTTGLFAWSRNPMYLGFAICALGAGAALVSVPSVLIAILFCIVLDRWYVRFEEAALHEYFGAGYAAYKVIVRRWI